MASSCIRLVLALLFCVNSSVYASICSKFQLGGPCALLPTYQPTTTTTTLSPLQLGNSYCELTCSQGNDALFSSLCACAAPTTTEQPTTTTTAITTTTPKPETCYYTRNRPAQLATIVKRMYSGTDVLTECEYPGVVGLFSNPGPSQVFQCMGTLLEEDVILIESFCMSLVNASKTGTVYAHVSSYQQANVSTDLPYLVLSSAKYLDQTLTNTKIYTVNLSSPFTFDDRCVQPACVPNSHVPLADIDDTDCRIVGYGDTTDTLPSSSPTLQEVKVSLNLNTISGPIRYTRHDGLSLKTGPCFNDQGGPLICSHKVTGEWITVGITNSVGYPCSTGKSAQAGAATLLSEAAKPVLYNALQSFKYIPV